MEIDDLGFEFLFPSKSPFIHTGKHFDGDASIGGKVSKQVPTGKYQRFSLIAINDSAGTDRLESGIIDTDPNGGGSSVGDAARADTVREITVCEIIVCGSAVRADGNEMLCFLDRVGVLKRSGPRVVDWLRGDGWWIDRLNSLVPNEFGRLGWLVGSWCGDALRCQCYLRNRGGE